MDEEWFRSGDWSPEAQEDFEARLKRARSHSRPQYLRIKGLALQQAGEVAGARQMWNRVLDSMGLVTLIVDVEQRLEEEYDEVVVLADERAMSQKRSPFLSVGSLADYICQLVEESA